MLSRFLFHSFLSFTALAAAVTAQTTRQDDERAADKAEIRAHIESIFQAYIDKDREKLRATHSEDWAGFGLSSAVTRRGLAEYMRVADISLKNWPVVGFELVHFEAVFHGDMALIFYVADVHTKSGDRTSSDKLRTLDVYEKRNGHWIQIASHVAPHPDAQSKRMSTPVNVLPQMRQQILAGREEVWRAWFANDRAKLEKMIPEDAIAINSGSEAWEDRAAILAGAQQFAGSGAKLVRLEFPRTDLQMYGNTIILYTTYLYETENNGKRTTASGRGTEIFVIRDNQLVNTGWHLDAGK
jgi:ketosteroid isomerase-like protein